MRIIASVLCSFFIFCNVSIAQSGSDQNFFEPNFVTERKAQTPVAAAGSKKIEGALPEVNQRKGDTGFFEFAEEDKKQEEKGSEKSSRKDKDQIIPEAIDTGDAVTSLRLIASSEDKSRLQQYTRTYSRILTTRKVDGVGVMVILKNTDPKDAFTAVIDTLSEEMPDPMQTNYTDEELEKMGVGGVQSLLEQVSASPVMIQRARSLVGTQIAWEIPKEYPVTMLPTWVLETESGAILLEGLEDPSSMITKNGKFLPPQGVEEEKEGVK